jgi:hypothetical protein
VASWDSLNHLNLVMALESEFRVNLSPEDAMELNSVGAIIRLLNKPGSAPAAVAQGAGLVFTDCRQEHIAELKRFIAESYGPDYVLGANDAYFRWQYERSPIRQGNDYHLRLAMISGRIAGCLGYVPVDISVGGRIASGCWLANWMVAEEQRKLGLGPMLVRQVSQDFEITLALGANQEAKEIFARMGWTDFGTLNRYVAVLNAQQAARLTEDGRLDWPATTRPNVADADISVSVVRAYAPDITEFWDQTWGSDRSAAGTRRTAEFLNWRYADHSDFDYRLFEARRGGKPYAVAVYRVELARGIPVRVGRIVEL